MKTYVLRSVRYAIKLIVLLTAIFVVLDLTNLLQSTGNNLLHDLFFAPKGLIFLAVVFVLILVHPLTSFTKKEMWGVDINKDRERIFKALSSCGFKLTSEANGVLVFGADNLYKKLGSAFNDAVTVEVPADGTGIVLEGNKKDIMKIDLRIRSLAVGEDKPQE